MHQGKRILNHLYKSKSTLHASAGVSLLVAHLLEVVRVFVQGTPGHAIYAPQAMLALTLPFAFGLMTKRLQRRMKHLTHKSPFVTGMLWVASFHALACSTFAQTNNSTLPSAVLWEEKDDFTLLFYALTGTSLSLTIYEALSTTPKGNGWIFGVVFTYLTLLFPIVLRFGFSDETFVQLYQGGMGPVLYYNAIHNAMLISISFFVLSLRQNKVVDEAFCDLVGRLLWTMPSVPMCYTATWRLASFRYANVWFAGTSVVTGILITLQKRGFFVSNLQQVNVSLKASHNSKSSTSSSATSSEQVSEKRPSRRRSSLIYDILPPAIEGGEEEDGTPNPRAKRNSSLLYNMPPPDLAFLVDDDEDDSHAPTKPHAE